MDECRIFRQGTQIYAPGKGTQPWLIMSGSVRLDIMTADGRREFAWLAVKGDVIGTEALLIGEYSFSATAISMCVTVPWPDTPEEATSESLFQSMARWQKRSAELVALRCGQAVERISRLILLLGGQKTLESPCDFGVVLPQRNQMAEITDLKIETVSRVISHLKKNGVLHPKQMNGAPLPSSFIVKKEECSHIANKQPD